MAALTDGVQRLLNKLTPGADEARLGDIVAQMRTDLDSVEAGVVAAGSISTSELADGAVTDAKIAAATITADKFANGSGLAALLTAGLGNSAVYTKTSTGTLSLLALNASKDRSVLITAVVTEVFANGSGGQPTFQVGQTGTAAKFWDTTKFTGAALGTVFTIGGVLTTNDALIVTAVPATGNGTGGLSISVLALPTS